MSSTYKFMAIPPERKIFSRGQKKILYETGNQNSLFVRGMDIKEYDLYRFLREKQKFFYEKTGILPSFHIPSVRETIDGYLMTRINIDFQFKIISTISFLDIRVNDFILTEENKYKHVVPEILRSKMVEAIGEFYAFLDFYVIECREIELLIQGEKMYFIDFGDCYPKKRQEKLPTVIDDGLNIISPSEQRIYNELLLNKYNSTLFILRGIENMESSPNPTESRPFFDRRSVIVSNHIKSTLES